MWERQPAVVANGRAMLVRRRADKEAADHSAAQRRCAKWPQATRHLSRETTGRAHAKINRKDLRLSCDRSPVRLPSVLLSAEIHAVTLSQRNISDKSRGRWRGGLC